MTDPPTSQDCALLRLAPALKQAREERGLSLAQVATDLKLPQHVLEHLEHGQFEQLGAAVFARGYMRSYARHLGVDERLCDDEYTVLATTVAIGERKGGRATIENGLRAGQRIVADPPPNLRDRDRIQFAPN